MFFPVVDWLSVCNVYCMAIFVLGYCIYYGDRCYLGFQLAIKSSIVQLQIVLDLIIYHSVLNICTWG